MPTRFGSASALAAACVLVTACQRIGPGSITLGRLSYNEVIQETSKIQTFANLVRAYNTEPTAFMDVTQISASVLGQGTLMGRVSSIGASTGELGMANLSLEYQESPTIQYQPLLGQALAGQVATPISIDSIANLFDSDWPFASLLTLSIDRLTPGYKDYFAAINALIALDDLGAIVLTSETVDVTQKDNAKASNNQSKTEIPVLGVNLESNHPRTSFNLMPEKVDAIASELWSRFVGLVGGNAGQTPEHVTL